MGIKNNKKKYALHKNKKKWHCGVRRAMMSWTSFSHTTEKHHFATRAVKKSGLWM
jgi:hypothetical protein